MPRKKKFIHRVQHTKEPKKPPTKARAARQAMRRHIEMLDTAAPRQRDLFANEVVELPVGLQPAKKERSDDEN